ncbi:MAG: glycerol-3-phosphate acyltransferase [Adlercreutzia equolifaciens]
MGLALAVAFAGCTLGHIFSPWLKFKGGKGIAVAAACLWFVFGPVGFFIEIAAFALGIAVTRCVSVGSIAAAAICPAARPVTSTGASGYLGSSSLPRPASSSGPTAPTSPACARARRTRSGSKKTA